MLSRHALAIVCVTVAAAVLGGCGGGSGVPDAGDTCSVEGVVYLPGPEVATDLAVDAPVDGPEPAVYCNVICKRDRDRRRLQSTTTDGRGRYRFEGLPRGEDVTIAAELPSGEQLQTRLRLRNRIHRADLTAPGSTAGRAQGDA